MMRLLPAVAILAFLILPRAAQAQYYHQEQLGKVEEIRVLVTDSVKDGCLPSPNVLKVEAELILRRSGISVTDRKIFPVHTLEINATGFALTNASGCAGSIIVALWRLENLSDQTRGFVEASQMVGVHVGPKSGFQEQLRTVVNTSITVLANDILKARAQ